MTTERKSPMWVLLLVGALLGVLLISQYRHTEAPVFTGPGTNSGGDKIMTDLGAFEPSGIVLASVVTPPQAAPEVDETTLPKQKCYSHFIYMVFSFVSVNGCFWYNGSDIWNAWVQCSSNGIGVEIFNLQNVAYRFAKNGVRYMDVGCNFSKKATIPGLGITAISNGCGFRDRYNDDGQFIMQWTWFC